MSVPYGVVFVPVVLVHTDSQSSVRFRVTLLAVPDLLLPVIPELAVILSFSVVSADVILLVAAVGALRLGVDALALVLVLLAVLLVLVLELVSTALLFV